MAEAAAAKGIPKQIIDDEDAAFSNATLRDPDVGSVLLNISWRRVVI
jgi:hypothetical protein